MDGGLWDLPAHDIDLVATPTHLLVLRKSAFDNTLNDVRIAMQDVDSNAERAATAVRMSGKTEASLTAVARHCLSCAVQLRLLPDRLGQISVTPAEVHARLLDMGNQPSDLLGGDEFSLRQNRVPSSSTCSRVVTSATSGVPSVAA